MSTIKEYLSELSGRRVTVIGMGVSNIPLIKMLLRAGVEVTVRDRSPRERLAEQAQELESLGARLILGEDYLKDLPEELIFRTPGLSPNNPELLDAVHDNMFAMALKNREENTFDISTPEEAKAIAEGKGGFLRSKWCGSLECELAMKERAGVSSRCMPLAQSGTEGVCPVCGKKCTTDIYWGVAY